MPSLKYKDGNLYLSFQYDGNLVAVIQTKFPQRKWNKATKEWVLPATLDNVKEIHKMFIGQSLQVDSACNSWIIKETFIQDNSLILKSQLKEEIESHNFKTTPYAHQLEAFKWCIEKGSGCLFYDCGLGKTKIVLDVIEFLYNQGQIKKALIIIPLSVEYTWRKEIEKHTNITDFGFYTGGPVKKRIERLKTDNHLISVVNYDGVEGMMDEIINKKFDIMVCDESTYIKNPKAKRTMIIDNVSKSIQHKFMMTGTPFGQRIIDVFPQVKMIAPKVFPESFWSFRNRYCKMGGYQNHEITGYQNLGELNQRISKIALIKKKEECLDIPDKMYETRVCEMSPEQKKAYVELCKQLTTMIDGATIDTPSIITQRMKLRQVTSGFLIDQTGKVNKFSDVPKIKLLKETLDEVSGKVIIWCSFIADVNGVCDSLPAGSYVKYTGEMSTGQKQTALGEFEGNSNCRYFVMTNCGGYGLNLQKDAYTMIFYSHGEAVIDREQAEDRIHRQGQTNKVTIIDLIHKKTIDETVVTQLLKKRNFSDNLIDNLNEIIKNSKEV